jgi:hypothetical protein
LCLRKEARHLAAVEGFLADIALGEKLEPARVEFALEGGKEFQCFRGEDFSVFDGYWTEHVQACG